jgi:RHS repeat-associated protein
MAASYDAANRQLTFGGNTLTYDTDNNLTSISDENGITLYSWNARGQLVGINGPNLNATFVYDGLGRRQTKLVNGNLTESLYDRLNPVQETVGSTVLANVLTGLGIDEFFTRTDVLAGVTSHLVPDIPGSIIALATDAGTIGAEYTYEPFGKTSATGIGGNNSFQYTSRENDETGLYFYRARYYHPLLHRFTGEDPLDFGGRDYNLYGYVKNAPLLLRDPLGLVVTCGPVASRSGGFRFDGDPFWRPKGEQEGPGLHWPYAPVYCYWDLVAPGWDITINYRICSDTCNKVDWIEEVSRTETPGERILIRDRATRARPYWFPGPDGAGSAFIICDKPR